MSIKCDPLIFVCYCLCGAMDQFNQSTKSINMLFVIQLHITDASEKLRAVLVDETYIFNWLIRLVA